MRNRLFIICICILSTALFFFLGMWLGSNLQLAKQLTRPKPEPVQKVQAQVEKKPVEEKIAKVAKPAIKPKKTAPAAPVPAPPIQPPAPTGWKVGPASLMSARQEVIIDSLLYIWEAGGLHCPQVDHPTTWTPGRTARVDRPDGTHYLTWAPACYR